MTRAVLAFFDAFAWLLRMLGVDYPHFRAILELKLTLDNRRVGMAHAAKPNKKPRNTFALTLVVNAVFGIFVAVVVALAGSPLVALTVFFAFVMVLTGMILIADYSSVLLDSTDNQILQPRPVSSRTILAARIAHIITYLSLLSLSLSVATFIIGGIRHGAGFVVLLAFALAAAVIVLVGAVSAVYLVAMRFVNGEKLRDIILYFQIVMTVLMTAGYQLMPRLIDMTALRTLDISDQAWIYVFPPAWFAGLVDAGLGHAGRAQLILSGLALASPIITLLLVVWLAPAFKSSLLRLELESNKSEGGAVAGLDASKSKSSGGFGDRFARILCRNPVERSAFELLWRLTGRDRQFKARTYPLAAFGVIIGAMLLFSQRSRSGEAFEAMRIASAHLLILYMSTAMLPVAVQQLRYSDRHEAAWMYRVLPLAGPGDVLVAAYKVLLTRLVLPAFLLVGALVLAVFGAHVWIDILVAFATAALLLALTALVIGRRMPFSEAYSAADASSRLLFSLLLILLPVFVGFGHFFLLWLGHPLLLVALAAALVVATSVTLMVYRRVGWPEVGASSA